MGVNGKSKGNKEERNVAKWFKDWTSMDFQRVPQSGGLRWHKADNISGDIICADYEHNREFPFSIEVKSYKNINFEHLLLNQKVNQVLSFWKQANDDANRANKIPILFMRYNGMAASTYFIVCELSILRKINKLTHKNTDTYFKVIDPNYRIGILHSDRLKNIDYYHLKKLIDGSRK